MYPCPDLANNILFYIRYSKFYSYETIYHYAKYYYVLLYYYTIYYEICKALVIIDIVSTVPFAPECP